MSPNISLHRRSMIEAKLELAEGVLELSNQIVQLTTEIFLRSGSDVEHLVERQVECFTRIRSLIQQIEEHLESEKEKDLFAAAGARWCSVHRYEQALEDTTAANNLRQASTTSDVVLPLLLDNFSWRAFIEFLRADLESQGSDFESKNEIAERALSLVRVNQEMKSKIAERKRIEERLSQLASIIESSTDAIIIHTLGGTMVSWNRGAELLYGYRANEVLGKAGSVLLPVERSDELTDVFEKLNFDEAIEPYETVHVRKGGEQIEVSTTISPVKDAEGRVIGGAAITRYIGNRQKKLLSDF